MKPVVKKIISISLPLLLGVFLIAYNYNQFTPEQLSEMKGYFKNADYRFILLSLFLAFLGLASRAYRWRYTLEHMGYHSPFSTNFMAVCIAYLMNVTIPRSGEASRALVLKQYKNIPFDKGFGTIIAERMVDFIILLIFIAAALIIQFETLSTFLSGIIPVNQLILIGLSLFISIGILILTFIYSKARLILIVKEKISGLIEGVLSVAKMPNKWPFLAHTLFIWLIYISMFYVTIFTFPETADISFGVVVTAFVVGSLAITFTNSGFGTYPVLIAEILLLYGVPLTAGTAFGWIVWISQMILILITGTLSFLLLPVIHKAK